MLPLWLSTSTWNVSGWHDGESDCRPIVEGDQAVLTSLLKTVPSFSLDQLGEQTLSANSSAVCSLIREVIIHKLNTTAEQPGVQQSCSVDAEWTINVEWAQQPGQ